MNRLLAFAVVFVVFFATYAIAQPPGVAWTLQGDFNAVARVPKGGLVVGGDELLTRLDEDGNELWTINPPFNIWDIDPAENGGFILCGNTSYGEPSYVVKMTSNGDVVWMYSDNAGDEGVFKFIVELPGGGAELCRPRIGETRIDRLDPAGNLVDQFFRDYHTGLSMEPVSGGVLIAGYTDWYGSAYTRYSLWKLRTPLSWYSTYGNRGNSIAFYAFELSSGLLMSLGNLNGTLNYSASLHNAGGNRLRSHILPAALDMPVWGAERANSSVVIVGRGAIGKYDFALNCHWLIDQDGPYVFDSDLANDGGLLVIAGSYSTPTLTRYEPEVSVAVDADAQIVPPGHSDIYFTATVDNILLNETVQDVWSVLWPPSGGPIVAGVSTGVTLTPGGTIVHPDSLVVLADYPAGEYLCRVHVGSYEHNITMGAGTFEFTKQASATSSLAEPFVAAESGDLLPDEFALTVYPNPFNAVATLTLTVPKTQNVCVEVYATTGQRVTTLHNGPLAAGVNTLTFNGTGLASGVYLVRAETEGATLHRKLVLVR